MIKKGIKIKIYYFLKKLKKDGDEIMEIDKHLIGKICNFCVLTRTSDRMISAKLVNENCNFILIENSKGFRTTVQKGRLINIKLCNSYYSSNGADKI